MRPSRTLTRTGATESLAPRRAAPVALGAEGPAHAVGPRFGCYVPRRPRSDALPPSTATLAKLTRPRLHGAVARPRLFERLDEAAGRAPIVWVGGAPGYGKTTLVAGWLEARRHRHLWYHVDPGDAVPATFAHFLQTAAQPFVRRRGPQALFPPQPEQDPAVFMRSLFRDLFALLPPGCVLVLDNFQDARTTPEQRAALAAGLEEVPPDRTLVVVSRGEPPPEFARLLATQRIARLDPAALACTPEESLAILDGTADAARLSAVQQAAGGWPAALVLWREHLRSGSPADADGQALAAGRDAVFDYFAAEVLARASPEAREALMRCAVPPNLTADEAEALGGEGASRLLASLFRRRLFVERRPGQVLTFHFHALFREYLLAQARQRLAPGELRALAGRAAGLLAARGAVPEALALAHEAQDWPALRALVLAQAADWTRQGRAQVLSDWIDALPAEMRAADAWLLCWQGRAWALLQPQRARALLERAHADFERAGDRRGQATAAATLVMATYHEWADFRPLDRWLPVLDDLAAWPGSPLDASTELQLQAARLTVLLFRRPDDPARAPCAEHVDALLHAEPDATLRLTAGSILLNHFNWLDRVDDGGRLVARLQPLADTPDTGPLMRLWWRTHLSFWHRLCGRPDEAARSADEARTLAERYGLDSCLFEIDHARADALVQGGDTAAARELIDAMERRLSPTRRMDQAYFHRLRSALRQRLSLARPALEDAETALQLADASGLPASQRPHFLARVGLTRAGVGDFEGALAALHDAQGLSGGQHTNLLDLVTTLADLAAGRSDLAAERLADRLARARAAGHRVFLTGWPEGASRLLALALARGIETDWVRAVIARQRLPAPPGAGASWPHRLRIRVLGGFSLERDGQPVSFTGKAQKRPLDLLKLLVALGGREVDIAVLSDALWPDAEGAAAKTSFDSTLYRLRKLLDVDDLLVLGAGKLSLAREQAWTDLDDLEHALTSLPPPGAGVAPLAPAAQRLIAAWRGPLLGDEAQPWVQRPREALRARAVGAVVHLAGGLERAGEPALAAALYRQALQADDLAESLHRGLMRTLAAAGQPAEALAAYRRCRDVLARALGVAPAAETQALHQAILDASLAPRR